MWCSNFHYICLGRVKSVDKKERNPEAETHYISINGAERGGTTSLVFTSHCSQFTTTEIS